MLRIPRFVLPLRVPALCLALWLPLTAHPQAAPSTPPPAGPATSGTVVGNRNTQLNDRIPPAQQLQLQAGDDKFAGRYIADLSPDHRGAVIVLHDSGQHQSWPLTVAALLDELPLFGWNTLAIELPAPAQDAPLATPAAATPATVTAPTATASNALVTGSEDGAEKQAQARIDAALKKLAELDGGKNQATVLIGFGSGAWRAVEFARKQAEGNGAPSVSNKPIGPEPLRALVLVDPRNRLPAAKADLPTLLPTTELATLDIVQSSETLVRADAEARRRAVLKQKERIYQQLTLPPLSTGDATAPNVLTRRIRGWIQLHATEQKPSAKTAAPNPAASNPAAPNPASPATSAAPTP